MARTHFSGPVQSANGFRAGASGSDIAMMLKGTVVVDLPSISPGAAGELTVTLTGAAPGDVLVLAPDVLDNTGLVVGLPVITAANTVKIRVMNGTGGSIDAASATWAYLLIRG